MKIAENLYFYEGDYTNPRKKHYLEYYKGIGSSNFMIITGIEQLMIDSGYPFGPHESRLRRQIAEDGLDYRNTDGVLFTHSHPDHTLQAKRLSYQKKLFFLMHEDNEDMTLNQDYFFEAFFNFPVFIRREIFRLPKLLIQLYLRFLGMDFHYLRVDRFFNSGSRFYYSTEIQPVDLPSHCPGHVGFYFPEKKILFSGDLFDLRCYPSAAVMSSMSSYERAIDDFDRVLDLDIEILLPGHGKPVIGKENVRKLLIELKNNTVQLKSQIYDLLPVMGLGGKSITNLLDDFFTGTISYNAFSRMIILYNILRYLRKNNKVDYCLKDGLACWYQKW